MRSDEVIRAIKEIIIKYGMTGKSKMFVTGEIIDKRPKLKSTTGIVIICAAKVICKIDFIPSVSGNFSKYLSNKGKKYMIPKTAKNES